VSPGADFGLVVSTASTITGPVGTRTNILTVTTDAAGDAPHVFDLLLDVSGAIFTTDTTSIDFGIVTSTAFQKITIRNEGNAPGTLAFLLSDPQFSFRLTATAPLTIQPNVPATETVEANPQKGALVTKNGTLSFSSASAICGPLPAPIALVCRRTN
jgi:hypothetical protein